MKTFDITLHDTYDRVEPVVLTINYVVRRRDIDIKSVTVGSDKINIRNLLSEKLRDIIVSDIYAEEADSGPSFKFH